MIVRKNTFESLLRFLTLRCNIISLAGSPSWEERKSHRVRVVVTFDDGWEDTGKVAFPLTQKWNVPIIIFICPGLAGKSTPFWPEHVVSAWHAARQDAQIMKAFETACLELGLDASPRQDGRQNRRLEAVLSQLKRLPARDREGIVQKLAELGQTARATTESALLDATLTWEDIVQIASQGTQFGSHTQNHHILTTIPATAVQAELAESKRALEVGLGRPCTLFAYPNGSWSPEVRDLVVQEGFDLAFVNSPGVWYSETDRWLIPRVNLWEGSLTSASGNFSPVVFQYATFWRAYRASSKKRDATER